MIRWLIALALLLGGTAVRAETNAPGATHIAASLVAESDTPRAGQRTTLAIVMRPQHEWHGYWTNPGDAGLESRIAWTAAKGLKFGPLEHPVPGTLLLSGLMNYVYEQDYALLVTLDIPAGLAAGTKLPISAKFDWLACNPQTCVPETAILTTALVIGDGAIAADRRVAFDNYRAALPRPLGATAHFQIVGGRFRLEVPLPAAARADTPYFFPQADGILDYAAPQTVTRDGDRLVIETAAKADAKPSVVEGVLSLEGRTGLALRAVPGQIAAVTATTAAGTASSGGGGNLLLVLGGAILGGLLLNIMPCVFPILSLKALGLARSGAGEREARIEASAYAGGVIAVCVALGITLLVLRAAGGAAGWAFQLQDVRVITALLLLVSAIALNLAGLFELPSITGGDALAAQGGAAGAFWTGALAAFVATPCSGPFMGAALGAALLLPAWGAIIVFAGLGLGLALPFLAIGFIPALRRRMPRPGAWMDSFRRALSVPMFVTALGLAWIAGRQAGVNGMALALGAALLLAFGLWSYGRKQVRGTPRPWWPLIPALGLAVAVTLSIASAPAVAGGGSASDGHAPFSEARLAALRAEGRPVFVYFTADWCLTCKVNEKAAIERAEVTKAFAARKIAVLIGDWTRGDPTISRFLQSQGRSGIPLYLYYRPGAAQPETLPQVLTPGILTALPS